MDDYNSRLSPLEALMKVWRKRREKLRKEAVVLDKDDTQDNQRNCNIAYGRFQEASKCSSDLRRVLNKMLKDSIVHKSMAQHSNDPKHKHHNRCLLYCWSYKPHHHNGVEIVLSYCLKLKRCIYPELFDQEHPADCPVNSIRELAGLEKI